jgi:uncharacterized protein YjiS (DUF1127 family)
MFNHIKDYVVNKVMNMIHYQRVCNELCGLSDRDLADMGITRGDIHGIAMRQSNKHTVY